MIKKLVYTSLFIGILSCSSNKTVLEKKTAPKIVNKKIVAVGVNPVEKKITAKKDKNGNLIGTVNRASFNDKAYKGWFDYQYQDYKTNANLVAKIAAEIKNYTIKGFMGTWCKDSKMEVPRLFKILEEANYDLENFELICVDRTKTTTDHLEKKFNILRVPTFIFLKNDVEIGRFVEYPRESLEKDILKIITGQPYKHSYEKH